MGTIKPRVCDKATVEAVFSFLEEYHQGPIQILPADEVIDGLRGFVAFYTPDPQKPGDERTLWLAWRYAKPVPESDRSPIGMGEVKDQPFRESVEKTLTECITEPGWVKCDDPLRLVMGFARLAKPEDPGDSKGVFIGISAFKLLSAEVKNLVQEWRISSDPFLAEAVHSGKVPAV